MRVVADTNTVISGLLWTGAPRKVLDLARSGQITLYTSPALLAELRDVLGRAKFSKRLKLAGITVRYFSLRYASLAHVVRPKPIKPVVLDDPDDDIVLACALVANAEAIVSGDSHLSDLRIYHDIPILRANVLLEKFK